MSAPNVAPASDPQTAAPESARWKQELFAFFELFALCGLLFAQPALDSLRKNSNDFLVARNASPTQIVLTVATIVIVPAVVLWAVEAVVGLFSTSARRVLHAFFLGALTATFFLGILRRAELPDVVSLVLAAIAGVGAAILVLRFTGVRTYLRFLAIAPIAFALLFLTNPAIGDLLSPSGAVAAADVSVGHPQRVVMIVLDEFPTRSLLDGSGRIDARLFPNFAALAGQSTWYRNATSVAPYTRVAVPAIADGRYPANPSASPTAEQYPQSIFTLLGKKFRLNVHEATNETLCPDSLCPRPKPANPIPGILGDVADTWQKQTLGTKTTQSCACDDETKDSGVPNAGKFLASIRPSHGPELDYVHVILPHAPWHLLASGQDYAPNTFLPQGLTSDSSWGSLASADLEHQRHLLQLQWVDTWLGKVIARLQQIGEYDSTSIVLTADHGVSFDGTVPYRVPILRSYSDIIWVPLIVKQANQTVGRIDDRLASTIDVMPTIADIVGAKIPWHVDGRSVLGAPRTTQNPRFLAWPSMTPFAPPDKPVYQSWDGPRGLERVLETPASNPTVSGDLALFGSGPYAALVGQPAAPLIDSTLVGPTATIQNADAYKKIDPTAPVIPWANVVATLSGRDQGTVALAVNGTVGAVVATQIGFNRSPYVFAVLPPSLFRPGANDVQVYVVAGTPTAPKLILASRV